MPSSSTSNTNLELQAGFALVFTLFAQLPAELRIMIWKEAFEPRYLRIFSYIHRIGLDPETESFRLVNWEARKVFEQSYKQLFGSPILNQKPMWINSEIDILYFINGIRTFRMLALQHPEHMGELRKVEIAVPKRLRGPYWSEEDIQVLSLDCIITMRKTKFLLRI